MESITSTTPALLPVDRALTLVARLGFVLVHDDRLGEIAAPSGSHLVVALRDHPTLAHFDPEQMTWFTTVAGRGQEVEYHRSRTLPDRSPLAWGPIHVFDRLEVQNAFLTFGGIARTVAPDGTTTLVLIDSPVPILRWSGHSQDVDLLAPEIAAFFARLRIPIDFTPGAESIIAGLTPVALYAAFVVDLHARYQGAQVLRDMHPHLTGWLAHEAHRLQTADPADWETGSRMLDEVGIARRG